MSASLGFRLQVKWGCKCRLSWRAYRSVPIAATCRVPRSGTGFPLSSAWTGWARCLREGPGARGSSGR